MNRKANSFEALLDVPEDQRRARGVDHTPREIAQQPDMWMETLGIVRSQRERLVGFFRSAGMFDPPGARPTVFLQGAGTSEYVGTATADSLRTGFGTTVISLPTTSFITHPDDLVVPKTRYLFISFARSGDSPESIGSYNHARAVVPDAYHLIITCNRAGKLANPPVHDDRRFVLQLPEPTNDQSLVMTSSFSSMALAALALCHLDDLESFEQDLTLAANAARAVLRNAPPVIESFVGLEVDRLQYLGTGILYGAMQESRLKVLEMTGGRIAANVDTYLGLRHGPQVFVSGSCGVVSAVSRDPYRRRYELDLLRELAAKRQGKAVLVIADAGDSDAREYATYSIRIGDAGAVGVPDALRVLTDVVVGQLIGLFSCLRFGLKPDNPSEDGIISRVVSGVEVYPFRGAHR